MGAGYGIGLLSSLEYDVTKRKAMKIIKTFTQQGYVERFVEVIHGEVYFFDYEHPQIMTKCRNLQQRELILNFYHQNTFGGSMPYSELSRLVGHCDGDTLCEFSLKAHEDPSPYRVKVNFDTDRCRSLGEIHRSYYILRRYLEDRKEQIENREVYYDSFCHFYEYLERVFLFYQKTGHLFLLCIGDW